MKVALVTGASGGIGSEITKTLLKEGYFTIAHYNTGKDRINALAKEVQGLGFGDYFFPIQADFSTEQGVFDFIQTIKSNFKRIEVLVNNAGVDLYGLATETTASEWDYLFNVNLKASFILTKEFLPAMITAQKGSVIFISSVLGVNGSSMESCYSASKSAMIGYAQALSKEVGLSGVRVNCVCPGVIDTPMNSRFDQDEIEDLKKRISLGRVGTPQNVADLVGFLVSEKSSYITGQAIVVDGGFRV
jgi:3-oxoacyl-[acyl-carrier protein] reductase